MLLKTTSLGSPFYILYMIIFYIILLPVVWFLFWICTSFRDHTSQTELMMSYMWCLIVSMGITVALYTWEDSEVKCCNFEHWLQKQSDLSSVWELYQETHCFITNTKLTKFRFHMFCIDLCQCSLKKSCPKIFFHHILSVALVVC